MNEFFAKHPDFDETQVTIGDLKETVRPLLEKDAEQLHVYHPVHHRLLLDSMPVMTLWGKSASAGGTVSQKGILTLKVLPA